MLAGCQLRNLPIFISLFTDVALDILLPYRHVDCVLQAVQRVPRLPNVDLVGFFERGLLDDVFEGGVGHPPYGAFRILLVILLDFAEGLAMRPLNCGHLSNNE